MLLDLKDTIVALSTPSGSGAIAMIRMSGEKAFEIVQQYINKNVSESETHTAHFVRFEDKGDLIDECVVTIFKAPSSYTTENIVELTCHASPFIIRYILNCLLTSGARLAAPGEFTQRAFLNGQMDLAQAEAVSDLIASSSASQHQLALNQMKGGVSNKVRSLRQQLIEFASLIELENDFGEEDVEFVDRFALSAQVEDVLTFTNSLLRSFEYGDAIKKGVPVAIVGEPNVGKSTLLNALLQEDKAIVSEIPGTTRDVIEDIIQIEGFLFRFIDTAGIRDTEDTVESLGIQRTFEQIEKAKIILFLVEFSEDYKSIADQIQKHKLLDSQRCIVVLNKVDLYNHACHSYDVEEAVSTLLGKTKTILLSAKNGDGLEQLKSELVQILDSMKINDQSAIISNLRHVEALEKTKTSLQDVKSGLDNNIPSDLVAIDLRRALNYLGEISGEISTDDLLESIFSNFCIGK